MLGIHQDARKATWGKNNEADCRSWLCFRNKAVSKWHGSLKRTSNNLNLRLNENSHFSQISCGLSVV